MIHSPIKSDFVETKFYEYMNKLRVIEYRLNSFHFQTLLSMTYGRPNLIEEYKHFASHHYSEDVKVSPNHVFSKPPKQETPTFKNISIEIPDDCDDDSHMFSNSNNNSNNNSKTGGSLSPTNVMPDFAW